MTHADQLPIAELIRNWRNSTHHKRSRTQWTIPAAWETDALERTIRWCMNSKMMEYESPAWDPVIEMLINEYIKIAMIEP